MTLFKTAALAICAAGFPLLAQMQNNTDRQLNCSNSGNDGDRARHCEMREQSLPSIGSLNVDPGSNGSVNIKGWLQSGVLVRARIDASGDTESAAATLASQVMIDGSGGQVRATGPASRNDTWWSVSYEIFVPQATDLTLKTNNGSVRISDIRGRIHFDANNGSVRLSRVAGEVSGATVNGSIQAEMVGTMFDGRQMELKTQNGSVTVSLPSQYSAHIQAETGMGRIQSDFAMPQELNGRTRNVDFNIGAGGPPIHITTGNGSIHVKRSDTQ